MAGRLFELHRDVNVSAGPSGIGVVADGVEFPDDTVVIRWRGRCASTVVWPNIETAIAVHGHDGATRVVWTDDDARRGDPRAIAGTPRDDRHQLPHAPLTRPQ